MNGASPAVRRPYPALVQLTSSRCVGLLQRCVLTRSVARGRLLHAHLITAGLLFPPPADLSRSFRGLPLKLASAYALCGDVATARLLFDRMSPKRRTPFLCNTLVRGYLQNGLPVEALRLFDEMRELDCRPDKFTFTFVLKACADLSVRPTGEQVHCMGLVSGFASDSYVQNSLMDMYFSCGGVVQAGKVFAAMRERTVVSWNIMISGLSRNGHAEEALAVYDQMVAACVQLDRATLVSVLPVCASLGDLARGRQVHLSINEKELGGHVAVKNSLIDMYSKCCCLKGARQVFEDEACPRDVISYTAMIGGYILHGLPSEALSLAHEMMLYSGTRPNAVTMASLLSACTVSSFSNHGRCLHGSCVRLYLDSDIIVETALIDMYAKCGSTRLSLAVFARGSKRTATWNAMISSYVHHKLPTKAINTFRQMNSEAVRTDYATITSVLPAYSDLADLRQAGNVHGYLVSMGFHRQIEVATGLIDVYAKAGNLVAAHELFDGLPVKDIVSWSVIIAGYGLHGHARAAVALFQSMEASGVKPNEVTFTSMLYSCSHAGLVDEGLYFFNRMLESPRLRPESEHYACIVDLLGRAGRLQEAYGLIKSMPFEANSAVWGALLGACVIHGNVGLAEEAAVRLFDLEPENTGNYVLLGNIYSATGRWEDAERVRSLVKRRRLRKEPGCSLVVELPESRLRASGDQTVRVGRRTADARCVRMV